MDRKWWRIAGLVVACWVMGFVAVFPARAQYIQHKVLDFESGDLSGWRDGGHCCTDSTQVVTSPVRSGKYAVRNIVRDGNIPTPNPMGGNERSEIMLNGANDQDKIPYSTDVWQGFSVYIDPRYQPNGSYRFNIIAQWHAATGGDSPILSLQYIYGGDFYIGIRSTEGSNQDKWIGKATQGVWHDFIFNTRFDYRLSGNHYVRVWMDGNPDPVLDYGGPVGYDYDYNTGPYLKMGIYRNKDIYSDTEIIYHDEYRRGTSCAEVNPDQGGPPCPGGPTSTPTPSPTTGPTPTPALIQTAYESEAESMQLSSMTINSDSTASGGQYIYSSQADNGNAAFQFRVAQSGDYLVSGRVWPTAGNDNSFYVTINQTSPTTADIWDILYQTIDTQPPTSWVWNQVSYRGSGTFDSPKTDPRIFTLTNGPVYTLRFQGREMNTKLDKIRIEKISLDLTNLKSWLVNWFSAIGDQNGDGKVNCWDWVRVVKQ